MRVKESKLRRVLRDYDKFPEGCMFFIEPGLGSDVGLPDCFIDVRGRWTPLELKRGKSVLRELRPTQRLWHRNSLHRGIQTFGLSILPDESVALFWLYIRGEFTSDLFEEQIDHYSKTMICYKDLADKIASYL